VDAGSAASLHAGLDLVAGTIAGTPTEAGARTITFRVTDAASGAATRAISLTVDAAFAIAPFPGPEVIPTSGVLTITPTGGLAPYFAAVSNVGIGTTVPAPGVTTSGAFTFTASNTVTGTVNVDIADARGRVRTVQVQVKEPFAGFAHRAGTDKWQIRYDTRRGTHAYRTDLERELTRIGLRTVTATGAGASHDELALRLVQHRILREVAKLYLLSQDGFPQAGSFAISFFPYAPSGHTTPDEATQLPGTATQYNVMEIANHGDSNGIVGRAQLDKIINVLNGNVENNGGFSFSGILGTDIAECTTAFRTAQAGLLLTSATVTAADVPLLQDLLVDEPHSGTRANQVKALLDDFSFRIAVITAHEIGHSLGLEHNGTSASVMAATYSFSSATQPSFSASDVALLQANLPGSGRAIAPATLDGWSASSWPGQVVDLEVCELSVRATGSPAARRDASCAEEFSSATACLLRSEARARALGRSTDAVSLCFAKTKSAARDWHAACLCPRCQGRRGSLPVEQTTIPDTTTCGE